MITNAQRQAVLARICTSRILARAADLEAADRLPGGPGLEAAAEGLVRRMRAEGAGRAELLRFPCGPERRYFGWAGQRRPFPEQAELWLRTAEGGEILLCRRSDNLASSMGSYRSTLSEGEVLEVVDVGFGTRPTDYRSHRMPGKLALASGHLFGAAMLEALANRNAEGLLCGPGSEGPDGNRVVHNQLGAPTLFGAHRPFGFNLSARQYNRLVNLLAAGESVQMRAVIQITSDSGVLPVVQAYLQGSDLADEKLLLVADLGQDGSPLAAACLEEVLRTLTALVVEGQCPPPRRSLELLLVCGMEGTVAWLAGQREQSGQLKAALHLDLAAPDAVAAVELEQPPASLPFFLSDLLQDHLHWAMGVEGSFRTDSPLALRIVPFGSGSPILPFVDREVGLPAVRVHCPPRDGSGGGGAAAPHGPLHRLVAALSCTALDLCSLDVADLPHLVCSSSLKGQLRLARRAEELRERIQQELHRDRPSSATGRHLLWQAEHAITEALSREQRVLSTCAAFVGGPGQQALGLAESGSDLEQMAGGLLRALHLEVVSALGPRTRLSVKRKPHSALERRADVVLVRRLFQGPLPVLHLMRDAPASERLWLAHNAGSLASQPGIEELVQWVDGRRTLLEIFDLLRVDYPDADLKLLWRFLEVLQASGLLKLHEDRRVSEA